MALFKFFVMVILIVSSSSVHAKSNSKLMEKRASIFLLGQISQPNLRSFELFESKPSTNNCKPAYSGECAEFVAGSYPTSDERLNAAKACIGNYGAKCAKFVGGSYPTSGERTNAAKVCRNNYGSECAEFVGGSYPTSDERTRAAQACENVEVECVIFVAGSYPTSDEKLDAAKACSGQEL